MLLFVTKKVVKKKAGSAWNFFNLQYQCVEVHISPNSKLMPPFSVVPSFLKIITTLRSGLTKWINKHTFNYHHNPSQLTSRIHPLIFPWTHKGFISPESLIFFPKPVYSTMVVEKLQIHCVRITGKYICESKNWICSFLLMPSSKTLPGFYH